MEEFNTFNEYATTKDIWWIGQLNGIIHYGKLIDGQVLATRYNIVFYETEEEYITQLLSLGITIKTKSILKRITDRYI